jgi:RNA polymerase sigma-70 factor (ECF subfamily)
METSNQPDDACVVRAVEGDRGALESLLRGIGPSIRSQVEIDRRWRASLDAEDVMQVTYLEAFLRIGTLRARSIDGFRGWLARIAQNNLRDALRTLQRDKRPDGGGRRRATRGTQNSTETLIGTLLDEDPTAGSVAAIRETMACLQEALKSLPESYRRVVDELDLAERSVSDVAVELEKSPGAVHMLRSRAHDRLRELLAARGGFRAVLREERRQMTPGT